MEEYGRGSAEDEMLRGEPRAIVHGGEFAFAYRHPGKVCEVHEEVGAPIAKHIKTKCDEVSRSVKVRN